MRCSNKMFYDLPSIGIFGIRFFFFISCFFIFFFLADYLNYIVSNQVILQFHEKNIFYSISGCNCENLRIGKNPENKKIPKYPKFIKYEFHAIYHNQI